MLRNTKSDGRSGGAPGGKTLGSKSLAARAPKSGEKAGKDEVSAEELGRRIQKIRKELGLSVPELAVASKVDPSTIYRIERGSASPIMAKLQAVAKALGTTLPELIAP